MKKFRVILPFEGSLDCEVFAENEDHAMEIADDLFQSMSNDVIAQSAQFGSMDVYEE